MGPRPLTRECSLTGGGEDRGGGNPGVMGREVYGKREKRGREAQYPKGMGTGRNGKNVATLAQYFAIGKAHRGGNRQVQKSDRINSDR